MKLPANIAPNPVQIRRIVSIVSIAVSILATFFLQRAHSQREANGHAAAVRSAWQTVVSPVGGAMSIAAVRARFNITGGGAAGDLVWQVASVDELRTSLLALEFASVRLREVKIARRGAGFTVIAEQTQ